MPQKQGKCGICGISEVNLGLPCAHKYTPMQTQKYGRKEGGRGRGREWMNEMKGK